MGSGGLGGRVKGACGLGRMVKSTKMGYRNFRTQQIWVFEKNMMKVEKKKNITPRDPLRDLQMR